MHFWPWIPRGVHLPVRPVGSRRDLPADLVTTPPYPHSLSAWLPTRLAACFERRHFFLDARAEPIWRTFALRSGSPLPLGTARAEGTLAHDFMTSDYMASAPGSSAFVHGPATPQCAPGGHPSRAAPRAHTTCAPPRHALPARACADGLADGLLHLEAGRQLLEVGLAAVRARRAAGGVCAGVLGHE